MICCVRCFGLGDKFRWSGGTSALPLTNWLTLSIRVYRENTQRVVDLEKSDSVFYVGQWIVVIWTESVTSRVVFYKTSLLAKRDKREKQISPTYRFKHARQPDAFQLKRCCQLIEYNHFDLKQNISMENQPMYYYYISLNSIKLAIAR